jgi:hypothetical protein
MTRKDLLGIQVKAKNGRSRSISHLYWSWVRHVVAEEGVTLPQSGSESDSLSGDDAKKLASALRVRAEKIRKGFAPRDAASFVQQVNKQWSPPSTGTEGVEDLKADFDDPDSMDETASFFESSGGATLKY